MDYKVNFFFVFRKFDTLLDGLVVSVELTILSIAIGLTLGFVVALLQISPIRLVALVAKGFVEFFRCTPALIQIIWIFYCVPIFFDVFISPFASGLLALSLNLAAFNAEAYRSTIQAIPRDHIDTGIALGLSPIQRAINIIFPQSFLMAVPVLITNGVGIFQQSALVSVVAIADLMYQGKMLATQTYRPIETLTMVALIYFVVALPVTLLVKVVEEKISKRIGGRI
jgi:polar amino acid transport system permease protein